MKRAIMMALGVAGVVSGAAAIGLAAAGASTSESLSRDHYVAARSGLENARAGSLVGCETRPVRERESCVAEVTAYQLVRAAEIEEAYRRNRDSARGTQRARIEARYQIERVRCAGLGGARKDACLVNAHAARGRALLEAAAPYAELASTS